MEREQPKLKILMFPWLAHGHIFSFLQLAKTLSSRNFTIYMCSTPVNLDSVQPTIKNNELSKEQIAEIAKGIMLLSEINFLWVIRFPIGEKITRVEDKLPAGFLETVNERGKIIGKWAPQTKILAHPSIGGFVSHCGWSSITESMYFGVPVIAMPMNSEQPLNARLVVEAGFGVEVEKDANGHYVGEEVAKAINKVMVVEKELYEGMRDRAKRLSRNIKENAEREANETAEQLLRICMKYKNQV
ncbi:hypothetical protein OROMI_005891 [Orobanche minor]